MLNMNLLTAEQYGQFVLEWVDAWNRRDTERILSHYSEQLRWCSPLVLEVMNQQTAWLEGKSQVRDYFQCALSRIDYLHFTLKDFYLSPCSLAIEYTNQNGVHLLDTMHWNDHGVIDRVVCYRIAE